MIKKIMIIGLLLVGTIPAPIEALQAKPESSFFAICRSVIPAVGLMGLGWYARGVYSGYPSHDMSGSTLKEGQLGQLSSDVYRSDVVEVEGMRSVSSSACSQNFVAQRQESHSARAALASGTDWKENLLKRSPGMRRGESSKKASSFSLIPMVEPGVEVPIMPRSVSSATCPRNFAPIVEPELQPTTFSSTAASGYDWTEIERRHEAGRSQRHGGTEVAPYEGCVPTGGSELREVWRQIDPSRPSGLFGRLVHNTQDLGRDIMTVGRYGFKGVRLGFRAVRYVNGIRG